MGHSIQESNGEKSAFLIDGFPRNQENLDGWQAAMGEKTDVRFVLLLSCPLSVCEERIMDRAKTSGRVDDNIESLRKRFKVFEEQTQPVIEHYRRISKLKEVDATTPADNVADQVSGFILGDETMLKKNST